MTFQKMMKTGLVAFTMVLTGSLFVLPVFAEEDKNDGFKDTEMYENAKKIVNGTIQDWIFDDFDGDGQKEAFVVTGDDETYHTEHGVKSLWYFGDNGYYQNVIDEEQYWYFNNVPFVFDDCKLLYVDARHGYRDIYAVKDDIPVVVNIPEDGEYYWIAQDEETGEVTAADKRETEAHVLEFDYESLSFYDTGRTVPNEY